LTSLSFALPERKKRGIVPGMTTKGSIRILFRN